MANTQTAWQITKIIEVGIDLLIHGSSAGSTGEQIASAFALNRLEFLPHGLTAIQAWERLDDQWQFYAKAVQRDYSHKFYDFLPY